MCVCERKNDKNGKLVQYNSIIHSLKQPCRLTPACFSRSIRGNQHPTTPLDEKLRQLDASVHDSVEPTIINQNTVHWTIFWSKCAIITPLMHATAVSNSIARTNHHPKHCPSPSHMSSPDWDTASVITTFQIATATC